MTLSMSIANFFIENSLEFYIFHNYYEETKGGVLGWIISSSICFVIYHFCYWLMSTLYIDVKPETLVVHSVFFRK